MTVHPSRLALALVFALASLTQAAAAQTPPRNTTPYPADLRESFVKGCVEGSGTPENVCRCFIRLLEQHMTKAEMDAFTEAVKADPQMKPSETLVKIVGACRQDPAATSVD